VNASTPPRLPKPAERLELRFANPYRAGQPLRVSVPANTRASICVYDSQGALKRALFHDLVGSSAIVLSWDGRSDRGTAEPAGVYYVRVEAGGQRLRKKLVLLR
jgi:hypothetical protein